MNTFLRDIMFNMFRYTEQQEQHQRRDRKISLIEIIKKLLWFLNVVGSVVEVTLLNYGEHFNLHN